MERIDDADWLDGFIASGVVDEWYYSGNQCIGSGCDSPHKASRRLKAILAQLRAAHALAEMAKQCGDEQVQSRVEAFYRTVNGS